MARTRFAWSWMTANEPAGVLAMQSYEVSVLEFYPVSKPKIIMTSTNEVAPLIM